MAGIENIVAAPLFRRWSRVHFPVVVLTLVITFFSCQLLSAGRGAEFIGQLDEIDHKAFCRRSIEPPEALLQTPSPVDFKRAEVEPALVHDVRLDARAFASAGWKIGGLVLGQRPNDLNLYRGVDSLDIRLATSPPNAKRAFCRALAGRTAPDTGQESWLRVPRLGDLAILEFGGLVPFEQVRVVDAEYVLELRTRVFIVEHNLRIRGRMQLGTFLDVLPLLRGLIDSAELREDVATRPSFILMDEDKLVLGMEDPKVVAARIEFAPCTHYEDSIIPAGEIVIREPACATEFSADQGRVTVKGTLRSTGTPVDHLEITDEFGVKTIVRLEGETKFEFEVPLAVGKNVVHVRGYRPSESVATGWQSVFSLRQLYYRGVKPEPKLPW